MFKLRCHWPVLFILPLAFSLYATGIFYGLPQHFDVDEFTFIGGAGRLLSDRTLDPGWYGSPAQTLMYLLALIFAAVIGVGLLTGRFESLGAAQLAFRNDTTPFIASGRFAMCLIAVAQVVAVYLVMRKLGFRNWLIVLLLLSLLASPMLVSYAAVIRMDILQGALQMIIVLLCLTALESDRPRRMLVVAGALVGVSVSTKYPGVVSCVPVMLTGAVLLARGTFATAQFFKVLIASAAAAVLAGFLTGPFLFLNFAGVLENLAIEARSAQAGATSPGFWGALRFYLLEVLPGNLGWPVMGLAALGAFRACRDARGWIILSTLLAYVAFISLLSLEWERWALPLLPLAVVLAGFGVEALLSLFDRRGVMEAVSSLAIIGSLAMIAPETLGAAAARWHNDDTRIVADRTLGEIVPEVRSVAIETLAPSLDSDRYEIYFSLNGTLVEWSGHSELRRPMGYVSYLANGWKGDFADFRRQLDANGVEYLIVTEYPDTFFTDRDLFPQEASFYTELLEASAPVCLIGRAQARLGPDLSIRRLSSSGVPVPACPHPEQTPRRSHVIDTRSGPAEEN